MENMQALFLMTAKIFEIFLVLALEIVYDLLDNPLDCAGLAY